jgi:hypothetical protein
MGGCKCSRRGGPLTHSTSQFDRHAQTKTTARMLPLWLSIMLVLLKQTSIIWYCNLLRVGGCGGGGGGRESPAGDISYRQALGGARGFMMVTW